MRECFQLTGKATPKWLGKLSIRNGRALTLLRQEVLALAGLQLSGYLEAERDTLLLQLLLRNSDLRALKPHHIRPIELPERGP